MPQRLLLFLFIAAIACGWMASEGQRRVAVVAPAAYDGAFMLEQPLEKLTQRAERVIVGTVTDVTPFRAPGTIKTRVKIKVEKDVKGKGSPAITLTLEGGALGGEKLDVGGVPRFVKDERVLLLLDGSSRVVGAWQGKYSLAGARAYNGERKSDTIKNVEKKLESVLKETVDLPENSQEVTSMPFTTYCTPWDTSDLPVAFVVNTANSGYGGPTGANFSRVVYNSWHNWQALTNSYPSFSFNGTTSNNGMNHTDGVNVIAWRDLLNDASLGPGVLGVNYCAYDGTGRFDSDTLIDNGVYNGDPNQPQFRWDWDNSITSGWFSLLAVMEHELGHGLSLGHSDQTCNGSASTPLMCPAVSAGVRKVILTDDSNGAASQYSQSGSPPGAPSGVTVTNGASSKTVNWTASSGSKLAYDIERGNSACSSGWVSVGTVPASSTSFVDNDFGAGLTGTYCYRVKALGVGGDSGWGTQVLDGVPQTVSVSPSNATVDADVATSFVATYRHTVSYLQLKRNDLIVSTAMNTGLQGCWVFYRRDLNRLYLRSDTGAYLDAGAPGTGTTVENSRCRLMAGSSSVSGSGTDLVVTFRVSFKPAFAGDYELILRNEEMNTGEWSAYSDHGDLTVE